MKFERFIAVFIMMNILLLLAVVFSAKNHTMTTAAAEIIYGQKVPKSYFLLTPAQLQKRGFKTDSPDDFKMGMQDIFENTYIKKDMLQATEKLPPFERAKAIVRLFSLMGDGKCLYGLSMKDKINKAAHKDGCSKDFAEIFVLLATYTDLDARMVSNGSHYGAEIYDGKRWIYIDPYLAMAIGGEDHMLSYEEFAERMLHNGWMRFDYFGGENHCMSGKPAANLPYFGDTQAFAEIYSYNGNNIFQLNGIEMALKGKALAMRKLSPYGMGAPEEVYTDLETNNRSIIRKYVKAYMGVVALIFVFTNILLPIYFLTGLIIRKKK